MRVWNTNKNKNKYKSQSVFGFRFCARKMRAQVRDRHITKMCDLGFGEFHSWHHIQSTDSPVLTARGMWTQNSFILFWKTNNRQEIQEKESTYLRQKRWDYYNLFDKKDIGVIRGSIYSLIECLFNCIVNCRHFLCTTPLMSKTSDK